MKSMKRDILSALSQQTSVFQPEPEDVEETLASLLETKINTDVDRKAVEETINEKAVRKQLVGTNYNGDFCCA